MTPKFRKGDPRTLEAARKGGEALAEIRRQEQEAATPLAPYKGSILDLMDAVGLTGLSWFAWRVFWKAVFCLLMTTEEFSVYQRHTERAKVPVGPLRAAYMVMGRRSGKTLNAALLLFFKAITFDSSQLAAGERAVIPCVAADRVQAKQIVRYIEGFLELPEFKPYVHRILKETIEFRTGVDIMVRTASFRTLRGFTVPAAALDEMAFFQTSDTSANPDSEILAALKPAMATIPDALLVCLSSPYGAKGELFRVYDKHFGKDSPRVLVWNADSLSMNSDLDPAVPEEAYEEDPVAAAAEYGSGGRVRFRSDVTSYLDPEAIKAVTATGRRELPPVAGVTYSAFCDPSGGSRDSMTLAVAHKEGEKAVLDAVRERRPPFSPDDVTREFAELLRTYRVHRVRGDRYGGEWPASRFAAHGITYEPSTLTKSEIYSELLAPINGERVELLDIPRLAIQLQGLERRVGRGTGKDSIDHGRGSHDDLANAAAGALVSISGGSSYAECLRAMSESLEEEKADWPLTLFPARSFNRWWGP